MQLILKEKRVARAGALRVVDFATTRNPPACERWVELTGLKQLFAIFMGKSKVAYSILYHIRRLDLIYLLVVVMLLIMS